MKQIIFLLGFVASVIVLPLLGFSEEQENWDDVSAGANNWTPTYLSQIRYESVGGNPGGFLIVEGQGTVSASTLKSEFTGDFNQKGYNQIEADFKSIMQYYDFKPVLIVRYSASYINWEYEITNYINKAEWQTFTINFDPNWTDAQAQATGWQLGGQGPSKTFQETMSHIWKMTLEFPYAAGQGHSMGVDNFTVRQHQAITPASTKDEKPVRISLRKRKPRRTR